MEHLPDKAVELERTVENLSMSERSAGWGLSIMTEDQRRVLNLIRTAFAGVVLGEGISLQQGQGLDDYANAETLASLRAQDEQIDWSAIPVAALDQCYVSMSFFDADGMRFHLPAYLIADIEGSLQSADVLFHLVYAENNARTRFDSLSPVQRMAVREFLLMQLSDPDKDFTHPRIEEALREYWVPHNPDK